MTTTFSLNRDAIVNAALQMQGWLDYTASADAAKITQMVTFLNMLIKAWSARGVKMWCLEQVNVPLVAAQSAYTIGPVGAGVTADRPMRIEEATLQNTSSLSSTSLVPIALHDYWMLGNRTSQGQPTQYWYDPVNGPGVLNLYPVPNTAAASGYQVQLWIRRYIQDIVNPLDIVDFPSEWYQALVAGLADATSLLNQVPLDIADRLKANAIQLLNEAESWDREYDSLYIGVDTSRMGRGYR